MSKNKLSYWKEFWYKRVNGGEPEPNTRKFWATVSWLLLCTWIIAVIAIVIHAALGKIMGDMPWTFIGTMTGILIGNAQAAIGWYTLDKNNQRKHGNGNGHEEKIAA